MTIGLSQANVIAKWLNWLRGTASTPPAALYGALHTGDPGAAGLTAAAAGPGAGLKLKAIVLASPGAGSSIALSNSPVWLNAGASETITHLSVWDGSSPSAVFLFSVALAAGQAWTSGNTFTLTALTVSTGPTAA